MTSKEALRYIGNHEWAIIDSKLIESFKTIEKDLEVLEIFKKHLMINCSFFSSGMSFLDNPEEFNKVKEWSNNDR